MRRKQAASLLPWIPIALGWAALGLAIFFIDPEAFSIWSPVGILIFGWAITWATFSQLTHNRIRSTIVASAITAYLVLRLLGLGSWFFAATIAGIATATDRWLTR